MKTLCLIALLALSIPAFSQSPEELRTSRIINIFREKAGMLPLSYRSRHQADLDLRGQKIAKTFELSEECNECTGEVISKGDSYRAVMLELTDQEKNPWAFKKEATGICVSIHKTDSLYYAVVLTY